MIRYADRAFISVNGAKIADIQSSTLARDWGGKAVPTMTPDGFNRGSVESNVNIDLDFEIAVVNTLATPKIEDIPFATADVQITYICGADQYVCGGIFRKTAKDSASGIGTEAKKSWTFGALTLTDAVGNSVLFDLQLT